MKKVLTIFKKWFLNLCDSIYKTFTNVDFLIKLFFCIPCLLLVASVPWHADVASLCTITGPTGIPYYFAALCLFLSMLFSIVIAYVGMGFVSKRKISSFCILSVFTLIFIVFSAIYFIVTITDGGIKNSLGTVDAAKTTGMLVKSYVLYGISLVSALVAIVLSALKIDPTYYKERNN